MAMDQCYVNQYGNLCWMSFCVR